jgi:hypothetical protein
LEIIFGAVVAGIVQFLKKYSSNEYYTLGILAVISLVAAGIYTWLVVAGYWESVIGIIVLNLEYLSNGCFGLRLSYPYGVC